MKYYTISFFKVFKFQTRLSFHTFQIINRNILRWLTINGYRTFNGRVFELAITCAILPRQILTLTSEDLNDFSYIKNSFHKKVDAIKNTNVTNYAT